MQAESGAPGWNRTSDTRFRKPEEGVTGGGRSGEIVLHSPGFWTVSMRTCAQACWAEVRRLVGIPSAQITEDS